MKFGVFLPNGSNGYIVSKASPVYLPTFEHNKAITLEAERQGLDFVLSMMKFRGFGGETGYWDACLESFTLMASLAAVTTRIGLFPSIAILSQHPAYVARMMATLDDISGGRCGLNIVSGWNKPEYVQMGLWKGDDYYRRRYDYAEEYLGILRALWRDGRVTHKSEFFDLQDCVCLPAPKRELTIVSAGQSPRGMDFVAACADFNFVMAETSRLKGISDGLKSRGREHGRKVGTYALFTMVLGESDAAAEAEAAAIIAGADRGAIDNIVSSGKLDTNPEGTGDRMAHLGLDRSIEEGNMAFMGFPVIHGSYETVARKIDEIADATSVDGILFSWPDFVSGVRDFGERVMPLLRCRRTPETEVA